MDLSWRMVGPQGTLPYLDKRLVGGPVRTYNTPEISFWFRRAMSLCHLDIFSPDLPFGIVDF